MGSTYIGAVESLGGWYPVMHDVAIGQDAGNGALGREGRSYGERAVRQFGGKSTRSFGTREVRQFG